MKTRPAPTEKQNRTAVSPATGRLTKLAALMVLSLVAFATAGQAQVIWYLTSTMSAGTNYSNPAFWFSATSGGTPATSFSSSDIYDVNGYLARTPEVNTATTFPGGTLRLTTNSNLALKGTTALPATINNLEVVGSGTVSHSASVTVTLTTTTLTLNGDLSLNTQNTSGAKAFIFNSSDVSGSGDMILLGGINGEVRLNLGGMTDYTGDIYLTNSRLTFQNSFVSGGGLDLQVGSRVLSFTSNLTFTSLTIAGTDIDEGTYTYAQLNAINPLIFANPTGSTGSITVVPEPGTALLCALGGVVFVAFRKTRSMGARSR